MSNTVTRETVGDVLYQVSTLAGLAVDSGIDKDVFIRNLLDRIHEAEQALRSVEYKYRERVNPWTGRAVHMEHG